MILYLNPPRPFWGIANTEIRLSRGTPFYIVSDEELAELSDDQKSLIEVAKSASVLIELKEDFVPKSFGMETPEFILSRPVRDIQRRYIARLAMAEDIPMLNELSRAEKERPAPRQSVIDAISYAIGQISHLKGEQYVFDLSLKDDQPQNDIVVE